MYLDVQTGQTRLNSNVAPHDQTFIVKNDTNATVHANVAVALPKFASAMTRVLTADSGVTGNSNGSGAFNLSLVIPVQKKVIFALSTTYSTPQDENGNDLESATTTGVVTCTVTQVGANSVTPNHVIRKPLETAVLGDENLIVFGDGQTRVVDSIAIATNFFRAMDRVDGQRVMDWMSRGNRNLADFCDLYDWAIGQGFTGR